MVSLHSLLLLLNHSTFFPYEPLSFVLIKPKFFPLTLTACLPSLRFSIIKSWFVCLAFHNWWSPSRGADLSLIWPFRRQVSINKRFKTKILSFSLILSFFVNNYQTFMIKITIIFTLKNWFNKTCFICLDIKNELYFVFCYASNRLSFLLSSYWIWRRSFWDFLSKSSSSDRCL